MAILGGFLRFISDSDERAIKHYWPVVNKIDALEPEYERLSSEDLLRKTSEFRHLLSKNSSLEDILPRAFAVVREATKRTLGQRHFSVQLIGGMVLQEGKIAEMKTGEGKTLVATLPVYLNALAGHGVHVVTVNDYLARRDTQWMGPIYALLGLSVGCLQHEASYVFDPTQQESSQLNSLRSVNRLDAYRCDITYGTNNEFGFDYLRDNMAGDITHCVQRERHYAIVDEVDNILIDEARTPLIISGPARQSTQIYPVLAKLAPRLWPEEDFVVDEKFKTVALTEIGISKVERHLNIGNLYDNSNYALAHYVENALKSQVLFQRDRDYVVRDSEVLLVDEFTGRLMPGRRLSDGLHQAIEAKEGVRIQQESITYATITLQNYFRMYGKLAGMTGTAATESEEFSKIYKLDVMAIPTHKPMTRVDLSDLIFSTEIAKFRNVADEIQDIHSNGRPVLVGTTSIEKSEYLSDMLRQREIPHQVLNAKHHEGEASIIAQAGRLGAVTVATNMAGRGTDIILGGNPVGLGISAEAWQSEHERVISLGGLHIIGTERHESRRIDNQLRGRSGRQGDPGSSRFYISLEDDLMRRFGGERVKTLMGWAGLGEDTPLEHGLISKTVENSQIKVEAYNFDIRKHLVDYDDVVNRHRDIIYEERQKILSGADLKTNILTFLDQELQILIATYLGGNDRKDPDIQTFEADLETILPLPPFPLRESLFTVSPEEAEDQLITYAHQLYETQEASIGFDQTRVLERLVTLQVIDMLWVQHITAMESIRQGIGLQAVGQRDPLVMYKKEGHEKFLELMNRIRHDVVRIMFHANLTQTTGQRSPPYPRMTVTEPNLRTTKKISGDTANGTKKIGRNDLCPCGSSKKYKRCHGT